LGWSGGRREGKAAKKVLWGAIRGVGGAEVLVVGRSAPGTATGCKTTAVRAWPAGPGNPFPQVKEGEHG
jgi:hypothetical protein